MRPAVLAAVLSAAALLGLAAGQGAAAVVLPYGLPLEDVPGWETIQGGPRQTGTASLSFTLVDAPVQARGERSLD